MSTSVGRRQTIHKGGNQDGREGIFLRIAGKKPCLRYCSESWKPKRLLDSGKVESVQEATEMVQISRSSFYKYKDDIFPYHENAKGKTVNMVIQLDDEPGLLSMVLKTIAEFHANILTIHQSVPVNGIASLSLSIDVFPATGNVEDMRNSIESVQGIHYAKNISQGVRKMKIAVMGYGTIGSGVVDVLRINKEKITKRAGEPVDVKYILDLREFPGDPMEDAIVHDYQTIVNDPEIGIVVETMGGVEPAYTFVKSNA